MRADDFLNRVHRRLIVSCQALEDEPLYGADLMARMAQAAEAGGAVGIRANTPADVRAIRAAVDLPIIGIYKEGSAGVYITPTLAHARAVIEAGADVVALDATHRPRPDGSTVHDMIAGIHALGTAVMADVSTLDEAHDAALAGADFVAPTLSGYTPYSRQASEPDFELLRAMTAELAVPVIAEGRLHTPAQARAALDLGAAAVVVGSAITRPQWITAQFVHALAEE